jgi:hypothetical protein
MRSHIEAIKLLAQQFKDAGGLADDDGTCNKIITSLPPSYNNFLTAWESSPILEIRPANLVTRLDREKRRKSNSNGGELSVDDQAFFYIQTGPPLTGARRSHQPNPLQRAANRQSPYPKRGSTRGRGNGRHVRFAASNGRSRISTRLSTTTSSVATRRTAATRTMTYLAVHPATSSDTLRTNVTGNSRLRKRVTLPISHRTPTVATSRGQYHPIPGQNGFILRLGSNAAHNITTIDPNKFQSLSVGIKMDRQNWASESRRLRSRRNGSTSISQRNQ